MTSLILGVFVLACAADAAYGMNVTYSLIGIGLLLIVLPFLERRPRVRGYTPRTAGRKIPTKGGNASPGARAR